jgi:hypothetical protein
LTGRAQVIASVKAAATPIRNGIVFRIQVTKIVKPFCTGMPNHFPQIGGVYQRIQPGARLCRVIYDVERILNALRWGSFSTSRFLALERSFLFHSGDRAHSQK